MEPSSYCGAFRCHVHCENFVLKKDESLKLFGRDEIDEGTTWLDMKNCSGILSSKTFSVVPNLEILNITNSKIQQIEENTFADLNKFKSLDVRESSFPIEGNTFTGCKVDSLQLSDLDINIEHLLQLKHLETITFTNCKFSVINKIFSNFESLKYLTFSSCHINKIESDTFDNLVNLIDLQFIECNIESLDCNAFSKLNSLTHLSFHSNTVKSKVDYEVFKKLTSLESVLFDLDNYKEMDFGGFPNLKTVQLGFKDDESNKANDELKQLIIAKLDEKNISYELVITGKVEVNMDEVQICC